MPGRKEALDLISGAPYLSINNRPTKQTQFPAQTWGKGVCWWKTGRVVEP